MAKRIIYLEHPSNAVTVLESADKDKTFIPIDIVPAGKATGDAQTYNISLDDIHHTTSNIVGQVGYEVTSGFSIASSSSTCSLILQQPKPPGSNGIFPASVDAFYDSTNLHGLGPQKNLIRVSSSTENGTTFHLVFDRTSKSIYRSKAVNSPILEELDFGTTDLTDVYQKIDDIKFTGGSNLAHVGEYPPTDDVGNGRLWWDTNTARMYVYDTNAWVVTTPGGTGGAGGASGTGTMTIGRVLNLSTDYLSGTNPPYVVGPIPAGEWLVQLQCQQNLENGTDEDVSASISKKYSVPQGEYLWFKQQAQTAISSGLAELYTSTFVRPAESASWNLYTTTSTPRAWTTIDPNKNGEDGITFSGSQGGTPIPNGSAIEIVSTSGDTSALEARIAALESQSTGSGWGLGSIGAYGSFFNPAGSGANHFSFTIMPGIANVRVPDGTGSFALSNYSGETDGVLDGQPYPGKGSMPPASITCNQGTFTRTEQYETRVGAGEGTDNTFYAYICTAVN